MANDALARAVYAALNSAEATHERSLDEYLRALLGLLRARRHDRPSHPLFTQLLREAFSADMVSFDSDWLEYVSEPDASEASSGVDYVERMLLYQIADLHRMAERGQLDDPYRNFGIASPTGNSWYNFDTLQFIECAASGVRDQRERLSEDATPKWSELADVLWLGQHYE